MGKDIIDRACKLMDSTADTELKEIIKLGLISYMAKKNKPIDRAPTETTETTAKAFRDMTLSPREIKEAIDRKCITLDYPKECIKTWERANKLYAVFNDKLFSGELPEANIFIDIMCRYNNALATYQYGPNIFYPDLKSKHSIYIAEDITAEELPEVLLHEMVHEYCKIHGINDSIIRGDKNIHTKAYTDTAREHGFIVDNAEYGTGHINPIYKLNI